jgi:hypothetical protein
MPEHGLNFDATPENMAGAMFGFQIAALRLIEELAQLRPEKAYIDGLRAEVLTSLKNAEPTGIPMEKERPYIETSVSAASFVFDHIAFR